MSLKSVSLLAFGDLHYSFEPPASRKPSYRKELDDMLDEIRGLVKRLGIGVVLSAGDHFHRKGRTSHAEVRALLAKYWALSGAAGLFFSIAGNHDMIGHNAESASETQPLGVLAESNVVSLLGGDPEIVDGPVAIYGIPYQHNLTPHAAACLLTKNHRARFAAVVMHADVLTDAVARAYVSAIESALGIPVAVLNGHIHEPMRVIECGSSVYVGLGSIARTSIAERGVTPSVAVVSFSAKAGIRVKDIPLASALPVADAFEIDAASGEPVNADLDKFVELVGGDNDAAVMDVRAEARELGASLSIPEPGIEEAIRLLDGKYDSA